MPTSKIALTIEQDVLAKARRRVKAARLRSLSAFVTAAVDEKLRRDTLADILDEMDAKHGPPDAAATAWARRVLQRSS